MLVKITEQGLMRAGNKPNGKVVDAKRALMAAAVGRLNVLFWGGCEKRYLASTLYHLLPKLSEDEESDVSRIYSGYNGNVNYRPAYAPPLRAPLPTSSLECLVGGGEGLPFGEVTLAHKGVLWLDDAADFKGSAIHMLSIIANQKSVCLARAGESKTYPADFQLVASTDACPCGRYGKNGEICLCSARSIDLHWRRLANLVDVCHLVFNGESLPMFAVDENMRAAVKRARWFAETQVTDYAKDINSFENADNFERVLKLGFSVKRSKLVWETARALASLDCRMFVTPSDIAEAATLWRLPEGVCL